MSMATTSHDSAPAHPPLTPPLSQPVWPWWAAVGLLFVAIHAYYLKRMGLIATGEWGGDWSHAILIPVISAYFIHQNQDDLKQAEQEPQWPLLTWGFRLAGPLLILLGLITRWAPMNLLGRMGQLIQSLSSLFLILGAALALLAPEARRWLWSPLLARLTGQGISETAWQRLLGLAIWLAGYFSYSWWQGPGRNDMLSGYSMILSLFGLMLMLTGPGAMRVLWFPVVYLALGVKVADRWWESLAVQLQFIAAQFASVVLNIVGLDADVSGSTITLSFYKKGLPAVEKLNVAEACAGLRMLMAFIALGVAMAFLGKRPAWQRLVMVVMSMPIAVAVNVGRVATLGYLMTINPDMAKGSTHIMVGMLMLIPAAFLFWLLGWVLDKTLVQSPSPLPTSPPTCRPTPTVLSATSQPHWHHSDSSLTQKHFLLMQGKALTLSLGLTAGFGLSLLMILALGRPDLFAVTETQTASGDTIVNALARWGPWLSQPVITGPTLLVILALSGWGLVMLWRCLGSPMLSPIKRHHLILASSVGMLISAAGMLHGAISVLRLVPIKHPVPLRQPLLTLASHAGTWELVRDLPSMSSEELEALGTKSYVNRIYRDLTATTEGPGTWVKLHVAYYTGTPDTVPHVPERCFVAGGQKPVSTGLVHLVMDGPAYQSDGKTFLAIRGDQPTTIHLPTLTIPATMFAFAPPEAPQQQSNVTYFFAANGKFLASPDDVRLLGFDMQDRYSYYCKIEVLVPGVADSPQATQVASNFLSAMLPEIMACLPDWTDVQAGRWPPKIGSSVEPTSPRSSLESRE